jgi:hypothetical protein
MIHHIERFFRHLIERINRGINSMGNLEEIYLIRSEKNCVREIIITKTLLNYLFSWRYNWSTTKYFFRYIIILIRSGVYGDVFIINQTLFIPYSHKLCNGINALSEPILPFSRYSQPPLQIMIYDFLWTNHVFVSTNLWFTK